MNTPTEEIIAGWWCDNCEIFHPEADLEPEPGYECSDCGAEFMRSDSYTGDSHQCPDCCKFAAKVANEACPNCYNELERINAREIDGEWVTIED